MSEKTFRDRIVEEVRDFTTIYAGFLAAYNAALKDFHADEANKGQSLGPWHYMFDIPFESSTKRYLAQHPEERQLPAKHNEIIATIHELGLEELHLGAISGARERPSHRLIVVRRWPRRGRVQTKEPAQAGYRGERADVQNCSLPFIRHQARKRLHVSIGCIGRQKDGRRDPLAARFPRPRRRDDL
jgi:hypothetical protein